MPETIASYKFDYVDQKVTVVLSDDSLEFTCYFGGADQEDISALVNILWILKEGKVPVGRIMNPEEPGYLMGIVFENPAYCSKDSSKREVLLKNTNPWDKYFDLFYGDGSFVQSSKTLAYDLLSYYKYCYKPPMAV